MSKHVYKMIDVVGTSNEGIEDAIKRGVEVAAKSVKNIDWFQVDEIRGHVHNGDVGHFQVIMKLGFRLEGS